MGRFNPLAFPAPIASGDLVEVKRLLDAKSDPNSADAARGLGVGELQPKRVGFHGFPMFLHDFMLNLVLFQIRI